MAKNVFGTKHVKYKVDTRELIISGYIHESTPRLLKKALDAISKSEKDKRKKKVYVYMKSGGGLLYSAVETHHVISSYKKLKIYTVAVEYVDSCALLILQGGDKRLAFPDAKFNIHRSEAPASHHSENAAVLFRKVVECMEKDAMQKLILSERGRPFKKIIEIVGHEQGVELTAKQALKLHLIDKIIKPRKE